MEPETCFLEAEKELRRTGRKAWVACLLLLLVLFLFFLGTCALSTFRDPGSQSLVEQSHS